MRSQYLTRLQPHHTSLHDRSKENGKRKCSPCLAGIFPVSFVFRHFKTQKSSQDTNSATSGRQHSCSEVSTDQTSQSPVSCEGSVMDVIKNELEDGEISGSESDHEMCSGSVSTAAYRFNNKALLSSNSDSDSSDDDNSYLKRKRQKVSLPVKNPAPVHGRKVNNIWGSVVQQQSQDAVTAELGVFGMDGVDMSRNVETYNFVLARKMMEKEREMEKASQQAMEEGEISKLDAELEDYMDKRGVEERSEGDLKRKRPVKDRLGPRAEMDIKGRYEITEEDTDESVSDEIAYRLRESKKDLIQRVVKVIGKKKAIELLGETATLEESGGLYTVDGSRRRTPGGVYFNLLKNTPSISKNKIKKIFHEEQVKDNKNKKAAQMRRLHMVAKKMKNAIGTLNLQEHDDVSRETFASDTNEALQSLEEAPEEEEAAVGSEDAVVVYNSTDLEVF